VAFCRGGRPVLEVAELRVEVAVGGAWHSFLHLSSLAVRAGEVVAILGESGCGKSLLCTSIVGIASWKAGVRAFGKAAIGGCVLEISQMGSSGFWGSRLGYVPQDVSRALNPLLRIGDQFADAAAMRFKKPRDAALADAVGMLETLGVFEPERVVRLFPHELSVGMQQRVLVGLACSLRPTVLVADEPTSALDTVARSRVAALLRHLAQDGVGLLVTTHDPTAAAMLADRVVVMYAGSVVELGPASEVLESPRHPYTKALLRSRPSESLEPRRPLSALQGQPPRIDSIPGGCRFHSRCPEIIASTPSPCRDAVPSLTPVGPDHWVACHLFGTEDGEGAGL